jgi:uncharacterized protein (UPF0276 family)
MFYETGGIASAFHHGLAKEVVKTRRLISNASTSNMLPASYGLNVVFLKRLIARKDCCFLLIFLNVAL